jgi:hypothetical protein
VNSEATAYHEAGHTVAAWRLGVKIRRASIIPTIGRHGVVEHESPLREIHLDIDNSDRARMRTEKEIIICLAGPDAQRQFRPSSWRGWHGQSDYDTAADLALRLQGDGERATEYLKWVGFQSRWLIKNNWNLVTMFADELLRVNTIDRNRVAKILDELAMKVGD